MRPRNALMAAFPGLSREEASDALRSSDGDVEKAKMAIKARQKTGRGEKSVNAATSGIAQNQNDDGNNKSHSPLVRAPPRHSASINNLSDRQCKFK